MTLACRYPDPTLIAWAVIVVLVLLVGSFAAGYVAGESEPAP